MWRYMEICEIVSKWAASSHQSLIDAREIASTASSSWCKCLSLISKMWWKEEGRSRPWCDGSQSSSRPRRAVRSAR